MKKQAFLDELFNSVSPEERRFTRLSMDAVERIQNILDRNGWNQKDLAEKLGKNESEVSKWLSVGHNLTLKSLAKIEIALDELVLSSPKRREKEAQVSQLKVNNQNSQLV